MPNDRTPLPAHRSLRWRLPLLVTTLVITVLATFLWAAYAYMERALLEAGSSRAQNATAQLVSMLAPAQQQRARDMKQIASDVALREYLASPTDVTRAAAEARLRTLGSSGRQVVELWNGSGERLITLATPANVESTFPPASAPTGDGLRLARLADGPVISEVMEPVTVTAPQSASRTVGYVVVRRPVATGSSETLNKLVGDGARIHLGGGRAQWTDITGLIDPSPQELSLTPGVAEYRAADGEKRLAALSAIPGTPWFVAVEFPKSIFLAPARKFLYRTSLLALMLAIIAGVVARIVTSRISTPLIELTRASGAIASGDFGRRVDATRRDEIGGLGSAFNSMVTQIEDAHTHLQNARDSAVAQARQAAFVADVAVAMTEAGELRGMLERCARAMVEHLDATAVRVWTAVASEHVLELQASAGPSAGDDPRLHRLPFGTLAAGRVAASQRAIVDNNVNPSNYAVLGSDAGDLRSYAGFPLLVDDRLVGVISMFSRVPVTDSTLVALESVARTLALGIERTRTAQEREALEEQLRRTQKIEAIGQLAGGLAHDFNNLLTIILGYANVLADQFDADDPRRAEIEEIRRAGDRGAQLTRQLLAFSRKQVLNPVVLSPNDLIVAIKPMLSRLIGESIEVILHCDPNVDPITFDPTQLELILVNLAVNARDAMPQGGRLTIDTANVDLDEEFCRTHLSVEPGKYVRVSVTDTGVGIDDATKKRIFEPFFTTKGRDKGTGLGLATVFGIVKQSGGSVWVYSEVGLGASFKLFLPAATGAAHVPAVSTQPRTPGGSETVLIVEDEPGVRILVETVLKRVGYSVMSAGHPVDAIKMAVDPSQHIDLLLTDVVMPDLNGPALARHLCQKRPGLRVLFMSGFADDAIGGHGVAAGKAFLQKPFTGADLASKVREVLDSQL